MTKSYRLGFYKITTLVDGQLELCFSGDWVIGNTLPPIKRIIAELRQHPIQKQVIISSMDLGAWDSRLVSYVLQIEENLHMDNIVTEISALPAGVRSLLQLAGAVPERKDTQRSGQSIPLLEKLGNNAIDKLENSKQVLAFIGETYLSLIRFFVGKARFRARDFWLIIQECGPDALPIITLISLLIGLILAFVGAIQLRMFGADIFVANLVALGMTREMGAMMSAIIMAGRTGAAFAAQLGTMQVNEEIDAFKTMGIAAMDFLVLPRMLALILMMPLLTLYADFMGMLGGMLVGVGLLDLSLVEYYQQTKSSITTTDFSTGLIKSVVFGVLVALTGCYSGMRCGRSSSAVGLAATTAVVSSIVSIVISDAIFTIIFDILGI